jgi:hypothetical protein
MFLIETLARLADRIITARDPKMAACHQRGLELRWQARTSAAVFTERAEEFVAHFIHSSF